jgi:hypothetical protein
MTICTRVSDRMPDVALGSARWTAEEQRHLAACVDCRAELGLVTAAAALGQATATATDPSATAGRVLQRLRVERARQRSRRRVWAGAGLATAAAAAVLAVWTARGPGGRIELPGAAPSRVATSPAAHLAAPDSVRLASPSAGASSPDFPLPELDSLSADALDSVLRVLDEPLARAGAWELPDLGDPGDQEFERAITGKES